MYHVWPYLIFSVEAHFASQNEPSPLFSSFSFQRSDLLGLPTNERTCDFACEKYIITSCYIISQYIITLYYTSHVTWSHGSRTASLSAPSPCTVCSAIDQNKRRCLHERGAFSAVSTVLERSSDWHTPFFCSDRDLKLKHMSSIILQIFASFW